MKKILFAFALLLVAAGAQAGKTHPDVSSLPKTDFDAVTTQAHPRLLMSDAEMKTLRNNIRRSMDVKLLNNSILAHADKCAEDTLQLSYTLDESGTRLLDQSRYALERIFFCAYAWRMTGKDKYQRGYSHRMCFPGLAYESFPGHRGDGPGRCHRPGLVLRRSST